MRAEFKKGDKVTYKPYEVHRTMYVVAIEDNPRHLDGSPDDRIHYRLANKIGLPPVVRSTGLCIMESQLFESSAWKVVIPDQEQDPNYQSLTYQDAAQIQNLYAEKGQMVILHEMHTALN